MQEHEPYVTGVEGMWVPQTGIVDYRAVAAKLATLIQVNGCELHLGEGVTNITKGLTYSIVETTKAVYEAKLIINCAGLYSDQVAQWTQKEPLDVRIVPFRGEYFKLRPDKEYLVKNLIYPVPDPNFPFLGVHFTLTIDGKVKIGPTAIPILGREQYAAFNGLDPQDVLDSVRALITLARGASHDVSSMMRSEFPRVLESVLVRESSALVPKAKEIKGWKSRPPGIRSQLVNLTTGQLEQDFVVLSGVGSTHILNAVSPGWTAALPFGRWVAREKVMPWL
jgi:L-2-hydroxyglutarate oxidase